MRKPYADRLAAKILDPQSTASEEEKRAATNYAQHGDPFTFGDELTIADGEGKQKAQAQSIVDELNGTTKKSKMKARRFGDIDFEVPESSIRDSGAPPVTGMVTNDTNPEFTDRAPADPNVFAAKRESARRQGQEFVKDIPVLADIWLKQGIDERIVKEVSRNVAPAQREAAIAIAYASASRGINFLTKQHGTERDFELFCLLNDPYYTRHTRPGSSGFSMEMFQSFAQVLRDDVPEWAAMSKGDLLFEYSRNRWKRLRKEHVIDITRTVFQALGRGERRPHEKMLCQHMYVSSEAARMVHLGLRHAPELRKRASPAQRAVLERLALHHRKTGIFASAAERERHHIESLQKAMTFREFTSSMPTRFRSDPAARTMWELLFRSSMFTDPVKYR